MMDRLRIAVTNSFVLKIIFFIIILSVIFTGMGGYLVGERATFVAKVNGQEITYENFKNAFLSELHRVHQLRDGQLFDFEEKDRVIESLRQSTLNSLIDEVLLNQYAKKLGLRINDDQVKKAIFSTPLFQKHGKFDKTRYDAIMEKMSISPHKYAEALRNQLITQQLIDAIIETDFLLKDETDKLINLIGEQRVVREATIYIDTLIDEQQVSDGEVKTYYDQNKGSFLSPEKFRVRYIKLNIPSILEIPSEREIQAYYQKHHHDQFTQPPRNRYRVIQTTTEVDAKDLLRELHSGRDFALLAKAKSVDIISSKNGGDIGWVEEENLPEELKSAGLRKKGQLSDIIESSVGFLVVKLEDIQPAKTKALTEVYDDIVEKIQLQKRLAAYHALKKRVSEVVSIDDEFMSATEEAAGAKAIETNWFSRNNLPEELNHRPIIDAIFSANFTDEHNNRNLGLITVKEGDQAFVIRVIKHQPEEIEPLHVVKDQIKSLLKRNKAKKKAEIDAEKLLTKLKEGKDYEVLETAGLTFGPAKIFNRTDDEREELITQAAFRLKLPNNKQPTYGIVSGMQEKIVLLALDEVKPGSRILNMDPKRKIIEREIIQNNAQFSFSALLQSLRKEAKIQLIDTRKIVSGK